MENEPDAVFSVSESDGINCMERRGSGPGMNSSSAMRLNIAFLALVAILVIRVLHTGAQEMLRMMTGSGGQSHQYAHAAHEGHHHHG